MTTYQYGVLVGLKYQESPINKANYIALISAYKAMNCGTWKYAPDIMKDENISGPNQPKN